MGRLRLAVIGVGHLGKEHARILSEMSGVELVGVADLNSEQAQSVAQRLGCRAYVNFRPLLHLADAAVVAVPTIHHHAIAREFLQCGMPLLVEKPLAATLEQAEDLVALAARHGTLLQVGHIERFNPALEQLQELSFQPKFVECERLGAFTGRSFDVGVVLDLMIHDLDILLALVRTPVRSVEALGIAVFGGQEDVANARLTFEDGCIANVNASRASYVVRRQMQIWSPEGFVGLDFVNRRLALIQPSTDLRCNGLNPDRLDPTARAMLKDELFGRHLQILERDCHMGGPDQLTRELRHFVDCVKKGNRPRVTGEEGRDAVALAMRVLDSIRSHRWEGSVGEAMGPSQLPEPHGVFFQPAVPNIAA
jgi:predicted dehydrogenase